MLAALKILSMVAWSIMRLQYLLSNWLFYPIITSDISSCLLILDFSERCAAVYDLLAKKRGKPRTNRFIVITFTEDVAIHVVKRERNDMKSESVFPRLLQDSHQLRDISFLV